LARHRQETLRRLPAVDRVLGRPAVKDLAAELGRAAVLQAVRELLAERRRRLQAGWQPRPQELDLADDEIRHAAERWRRPPLEQVINATGIVVHTNLGRSPLGGQVLERVGEIAGGYSNLEFDLESGERGQRMQAVRQLLLELSAAEEALVVNNNAAAVYLALRVLAAGGEVVVSRGELVEIGGSFRIPDVMAASGAHLVEVGTTNRTRIDDYRRAMGPQTALLLKVHRSNFEMVGFVQEPGIEELAELAQRSQLPLLVDMGWATFLPDPPLWLGPQHRPDWLLSRGVDVVCFSGDKILGGPQCGIILGRADLVGAMARDPMARALRVGKLTLAGLWATLDAYRQGLARQLPVADMLLAGPEELKRRARRLARLLRARQADLPLEVVASAGKVGGGALPLLDLPGWAVAVHAPGQLADRLAETLRRGRPPVVARVHDDSVWLDVRTLSAGDFPTLVTALARAWNTCRREEAR